MPVTSLAAPCGGLCRPHRPVRRSLAPSFATPKEAEAAPASSSAPKVRSKTEVPFFSLALPSSFASVDATIVFFLFFLPPSETR